MILTCLLVALVVAGGLLRAERETQSTVADERLALHGNARTPLVAGASSLTARRDLFDARQSRWSPSLADEKACPGGERTDLPLRQQATVMACLVNHERAKRGLASLARVAVLNNASTAKAERIVRCSEFSHAACGRRPDFEVRAAGYRGAFGENLYLAEGSYRTPRAALDSWLDSPAHRANLLRPGWRTQGIAIRTVEQLGPYRDAVRAIR